jgi:hypothetical protein
LKLYRWFHVKETTEPHDPNTVPQFHIRVNPCPLHQVPIMVVRAKDVIKLTDKDK